MTAAYMNFGPLFSSVTARRNFAFKPLGFINDLSITPASTLDAGARWKLETGTMNTGEMSLTRHIDPESDH